MKDVLLNKIKSLDSKEEKYNITREFLQELVLQIIDKNGYFKDLAFVGGTALRILYDLPRFSEDLDFSLIQKKGFIFTDLLKDIESNLNLNGFLIEETRGKEKTVNSEFIRFKGLLYELGLSAHKNEKLFIKLEIDTNPPTGFESEVQLVNKDFLFKVLVYKPDSLFASKLHAILFRKYEKGRDFYDLLWFLTRKTPINYILLSNAAKQTQKKDYEFDQQTTKLALLERIDAMNFNSVLRDLLPFLAKKEEAEYFKKEYFIQALEKYFLLF